MITFNNVTQKYEKSCILENTSFTINENEVCVIVGKNGAGKSTLIQTMVGLLKPIKGIVEINGMNIAKSTKWKKDVSYLPEKFQLYPLLTVFENVQFFASFQKGTEEQIIHALTLTGLIEHKNLFAKQLSKGMLQRLGLSLIFLRKSPIIILDEPTSGIDPFGRHDIVMILERLKLEGKTIVFSSHHMEEVSSIATHVLYIDDNHQVSKMKAKEFLFKWEALQA